MLVVVSWVSFWLDKVIACDRGTTLRLNESGQTQKHFAKVTGLFRTPYVVSARLVRSVTVPGAVDQRPRPHPAT
uniref:Neur_chan_memb domain-containing protein n=1 Tax=Caenorhabditis japonica TaxID=281687 RepID=A0A8R1INZ2_CAEJA